MTDAQPERTEHSLEAEMHLEPEREPEPLNVLTCGRCGGSGKITVGVEDAQPERDNVKELREWAKNPECEWFGEVADELAALRERLRYAEMTIAQCDAPTELQRRYGTPEFRKAYAETKNQEPPTLEPVEPTQPERDLVEWLRDYAKRLRNCEANKAAETIMKADAARMDAAADELAALDKEGGENRAD